MINTNYKKFKKYLTKEYFEVYGQELDS